MLTSNTEILRRLGALERQLEECKNEITMRSKEKRVDNDGYIIAEGQDGTYSLVGKEFYYKSLQAIVEHANQKLAAVKK